MSELKAALCKLSDIGDGEMREFDVGETPVLLTRVGGKVNAIGARCTHYGAPLVDGFLAGDKIICPWHHACFNARTGDLIEPPALDSLPNYQVRIEGDDIYVDLSEDADDRRTPEMVEADPSEDGRTFVILGAGAAGYMAAQTLREDGFAGLILMITREDRMPYDRPNLSKDYLAGNAEPEWMPLRPGDFFDRNRIEVLRGREVVGVDSSAKGIMFADGESLNYDAMLIATGGVPRSPGFVKGSEENVFLLRSFRDADAIVARAEKGSRAVVIGSSFIGMEAAASLKTRGCDVTVVSPDEVPFEKVLGVDIGKLFKSTHEQNGIKFKLGRSVKGLTGSEKIVDGVELDDGERLEVDLVVIGIGVRPATDLLKGVEIHKDGGVITDEHLCVGEDLYAAGDIAYFPDARTGEMTRIEHWRTALQLGRTAAHNMAGKPTPFAAVPFFWTTQFDVTLNYVGHVREWDSVVFQGDPESREFLAFYIKDHRILAVAGMNRDRDIAIWEELIRQNQVPSPSELDSEANVSDLLSSAANNTL